MSFENVNLWFAKDKNNEIMMIKDIIEENKHNEYTCPICGGLVRANTGTIKSWYFSHINADDCSSETIVHWFVKHELLKVGEKFKVKINDEIKEYVCKEIIEEKEYNTKYGVYRPDLTVITTTNEIIYIEVANTNGKKIKDFIDMWKELGNTVIEFKVGEVLNGNKIEVFNSIWYEGKEYYNQLKELREVCNKEKEKYEFTKEQVEQIDWLINDICKYNNGLIEIDKLSDEIQCIENEEQRQLVCNIVKNKKCGTVLNDYIEYNKNNLINLYNNFYNNKIKTPNAIHGKLFGQYEININFKNYCFNILVDLLDKEKVLITLNNIIYLTSNYYFIDKDLIWLIEDMCDNNRIKKVKHIYLSPLEDYLYSEIDFYEDKALKYNIKRRILLNGYKNKGIKIQSNIFNRKEYKINNSSIPEIIIGYYLEIFLKTKDKRFLNNILCDISVCDFDINKNKFYLDSFDIKYGKKDEHIRLNGGGINVALEKLYLCFKNENKNIIIQNTIDKLNQKFIKYVYRCPQVEYYPILNKVKVTISCKNKETNEFFRKDIGSWYIEEDYNIDKLESDIYNTIRKYKYPNWEADN